VSLARKNLNFGKIGTAKNLPNIGLAAK